MSSTLQAAVIGLGNISSVHIEQWQKADGVELVAGADINAEAVAKAQDAHGIRGFTDWREMLDKIEPDVVSICTPPAMHREMGVECLQRGVSVMCEKPLAADVPDGEEIAATAREAEAKFMVAYCHRWHPTIIAVKEVLDAGTIGRSLMFRCAFAGWNIFSGNHRANLKLAGGGALMDNGSHAADIYQYLLGRIANVSCRAGTKVQDMETDDVAIMIFEGQNGCYGEIIVGYSLPGSHTEFRIIGDKGFLRLDDYFAGPVKIWLRETQQWSEHAAPPGNRFDGEFAHFLAAVRGETELLSTADTALHVQKAIGAAYEDARRKGVPVS